MLPIMNPSPRGYANPVVLRASAALAAAIDEIASSSAPPHSESFPFLSLTKGSTWFGGVDATGENSPVVRGS